MKDKHFKECKNLITFIRYRLFPLLLPLLVSWPANASKSTSLDFLRIVPSVRAYGLAGNSQAVTGAESLGLNPAGVGEMAKNWEVYTTFYQPYQDASYSHLALAKRFSNGPSIFAGVTHFTIQSGETTNDQQQVTGGSTLNQDIALCLGMAGKVWESWGWGVNARAARSDLAGYASNWSWGGDVGVRGEVARAKLGAYVKNLGTGIKFISESSPLPTELSVEAGYPIRMVMPVIGYHRDIHLKTNALSLGTEGAFGPFRLRGGYRLESGAPGTTAADNFFIGAGGTLGAFTLDYGLSQQNDQNTYLHRIGISAAWGTPK